MIIKYNVAVEVARHAVQVDLSAQTPSIEKMDATLGVLKACR